jgi:hypothetical protein
MMGRRAAAAAGWHPSKFEEKRHTWKIEEVTRGGGQTVHVAQLLAGTFGLGVVGTWRGGQTAHVAHLAGTR